MISNAERRHLADQLNDATRLRVAQPPISAAHPDADLADAYAIQRFGIDRRLHGGARIVGWKVGLTSQAMQRQLGVDQPDFGPLLDDMAIPAGDTVDLDTLIAPRVEAEFGFRLSRPLSGDVDRDTVAAAISGVMPSLEIIDSRIADWKITLIDTVADHASCARFVLGDQVAALDAVDLHATELVLIQDGDEVARGSGDAVLGDPLAAIIWLARTLDQFGQRLEAGQVVMAGAVHGAVPAAADTVVTAVSSDPALGSVSVAFTKGADNE